jgi:RHS repeat-associated protein
LNEPFGAGAVEEDPRNTGTRFEFNLRFPGQYYDKETNTHYNEQRDYNPTTGRYIQADPIGLDGGVNLYGYVQGNPLSYTDPTGLIKGDRWYGFNNREFQRWFHRCWKQPGNPDAGSEEMAEAYAEWVRNGSPTGGRCGSPPPPAPDGEVCGDSCKEKVATVVIAGGTAYVVYRCVRMVPSLAIPPLWPTIPINAVVP